jgi:hypothetical protein
MLGPSSEGWKAERKEGKLDGSQGEGAVCRAFQADRSMVPRQAEAGVSQGHVALALG